jgi:adenine-specific DNA-methyltransferase
MMEKMKMHSPNLTQENVARIAELFPGCVTEAKGEDGSVKLAVDFDQLRQELADSVVEWSQERYHLNWPGKREALLTANAPIAKTLRPYRNESVDFDTTKNLFIEGDNLDALKLLQENYLGKVKMIYIDPPYNTGSDFIYEDDFAEDAASYFENSKQIDQAGNRLVANTESNGRFHSDWLSMMFARLRLAKNLLRDDGTIFISIDDFEASNLRALCDEIFGSQNYYCTFVWKRRSGAMDSVDNTSVDHEYVLCYGKSKGRLAGIERTYDGYTNPDNDPRGPWKADNLSAGKAGGHDLDGGLPRGSAGIAPRLQQIAQFADVLRSAAVLQPEMGKATLGSAFGGTVEQFVEVLAAQQEHVFHEGGRLVFGFGHCRSPEMRNPPRGRVQG